MLHLSMLHAVHLCTSRELRLQHVASNARELPDGLLHYITLQYSTVHAPLNQERETPFGSR
jgi:hypothetical protein